MKYAIVVSKKDKAGINIKDNLLKLFKFKEKEGRLEKDNVKLYTVDKDSIYCEGLNVEEDVIIFATRHQSAAGTPSLSVHVPGNWDKAEYGGEEKTLNVAPASLMKELFVELNEQGKEFKGEITLEATHHGPKVEKPIMFIEIGSNAEQWVNKGYGEIIAKTLMAVLNKEVKKYKTYVGIGGGHYPRPFNKVLLRTEYAVSNVCPKYMLEKLDKGLLKEALTKSVEKVEGVMVDWKGMGEHKEKIVSLCEELGVELVRVQNLLKNS